MTVDEWVSLYLSPFDDETQLKELILAQGGFAGWVLDGVLASKNIDGQEATDHECLEMISLLTTKYLDAVERGVDAE